MDGVIEKLSDSNNKISDFYAELPHVCEENSLRGQKAQRAIENFAWNIRLLKAQFTLASKTQRESRDIVQQVEFMRPNYHSNLTALAHRNVEDLGRISEQACDC